MKNIPFFNYPSLFEQRKDEYLNIVQDVLSRGAYIMQQDLIDFENDLAKYLGVKHAIGVADGTMALLTSLMAAGIGKGDEVIVPSHTFIASAAAIHHSGASPILADCQEDHLISPGSVAKLITSKTKAIMPVQLNGRVANMDAINKIAVEHNLIIIEDSCQALGAKYKDQFAGTFGLAGTFSFFPAKTLGCFGDGGAVVTNNDEIAAKIKMIRDHGRDPTDGKVKVFGFNSRLDNLQAAVLGLKLRYYDEDIDRRRQIATLYHFHLSDIDQILLPPAPDSEIDHFDVFQNYEIEVQDRDKLRRFLSKAGVGTILQWGGYAIHQYSELGFDSNLRYTEEMTKKFMLLPLHVMLSDEDVVYICQKINEFYNSIK
ncbi:MAG: DegT/DnrJ/EryC1/StrS family aminotransferase [Gammaproteobacteria bacterium]|nr:DegT/DnrJ/EryC1/StrS family aminotransferase [Gammaproteobacteria bacterium]